MFLFEWIGNLLTYFGFKKNKKLTILGLDNAGKTTLLLMLSDYAIPHNAPIYNRGPQIFDVGTTRFETVDLVGPPGVRKVWTGPYPTSDAIIFMVDCADHERFLEAKEELHKLLQDENNADVPLAVLYNKIDRKEAANEKDISDALNLVVHKTGKQFTPKPDLRFRPLETFPCSLKDRVGYGDALMWLAHYVE